LAGKEWLSVIFASAVHVVEADLAVSGDKADAAALRERAWEMAWITHEIIRAQFEAGRRRDNADLPASRYALLQAEIALVRAGQAKRPGRVGSLLSDPAVGKNLDPRALAQARVEVGRTDLGDLLRQRLETARTGYRAQEEQFLTG